MPLRALKTADELVYQISGPEDAPAIAYLPGVHGDWTPNEAARAHLSSEARLLEVAYPHREDWTLGDFVASLVRLFDRLDIGSAHLVGESFGSLVAWEAGFTQPGRVNSLLLVGGFVQPPPYGVATSAKWFLRGLPTPALELGIDTYVRYKSRKGERRLARSPGVSPYAASRTRGGKRATASRMAIIERSDVRERLRRVSHPVRYIGGGSDLVIPVTRELETLSKYLPAHTGFEGHLIDRAPHAIIASHPEKTARALVGWVNEIEQSRQATKRRQPALA
ncbi:MAG: alpha/beta fold hydrolase [Gammaproteobacteria bacterium]